MWKLPLQKEVEELLVKSEDEIKQEGESDKFKRLQLYRKMEDVELVLRFFAYRHLEKFKFSPSLDKFLDDYLKQANNLSDEVLHKLESIFKETIELVYTIFGNSAFLLPAKMQKSKTPRKSVYDPLMQVFSKYLRYKSNLIKKAEIIRKERYSDKELLFLIDKNRELFDGRFSDQKDIQLRIDYFDNFLQQYIQ
ncbi:hypothetical protein GM3708_3105 [Geminocystis sp. NIES-3708]|uniref:hypothetical protein n=1 Tax=Geminocystis sp. NIES-3708 TaxID=1615909 RepID=UPI0005FC81EE|nr:hypothetical protein [Geminocystis sp. NIES-3708]BAQ62699.1 hypothetical protein GM3708_3105 [Geminocystis sp. NIES-3708]